MSSGRPLSLIAALAVAAVALYYIWPLAMQPFDDRSTRSINIADTRVAAEVVSTEVSREQGLSGRVSLAPDTAMLFVFEHDDLWGIWMKDMKFSIDIVWLDAQGVVVTVVPDASPDSYPAVFNPASPARYAIELPAGFATTHGVAVGTKVVI